MGSGQPAPLLGDLFDRDGGGFGRRAHSSVRCERGGRARGPVLHDSRTLGSGTPTAHRPARARTGQAGTPPQPARRGTASRRFHRDPGGRPRAPRFLRHRAHGRNTPLLPRRPGRAGARRSGFLGCPLAEPWARPARRPIRPPPRPRARAAVPHRGRRARPPGCRSSHARPGCVWVDFRARPPGRQLAPPDRHAPRGSRRQLGAAGLRP
jgi:hypothetical protein